MFKLRAAAIAVVVLGACAEEPSVVEGEEEKGQIGASSGPNPNFGGAAAGDAFRERIPPEQDDNAETQRQGEAATTNTSPP